MLNHERRRNIALVISLSGAIAVALAALVPDAAMPMTVRSFLFCFGLLFFVGAALFAWFTHQAVRAMAVLARGEGVLARWQVDAATARAFAGAEHNVEAGPPQRYNDFIMPKHIPQDGLHVIIGKEAIQIGDSIQVLARPDTAPVRGRIPRDMRCSASPCRPPHCPMQKRPWPTTETDAPAIPISSTVPETAPTPKT